MRRLALLVAVLALALLAALPAAAQTEEPAAASCEVGFRLFEDEHLATDPLCIPEAPQRIVAIDKFSLETLVALGIVPVASSDIGALLVDHPQLGDQLADVVDLGSPANLETLLGVQPDLIIGIAPRLGEAYDQLSAIAPTVSLAFTDSSQWRAIAQSVGSVVGQPEALETAFAAFDARVQTFRDLLAEQPEPVGEVSVVFLYPEWTRLYLTGSYLGTIIDAAGLTFPEKQFAAAGDTTFGVNISKEQLDLLDTSDHIFIWTYATNAEQQAANDELVASFTSDPLWQALPAVQAGKVHIVGGYWIGSSLISAHAVLDDLFVNLAGAAPADVSPDPFVVATPEAES